MEVFALPSSRLNGCFLLLLLTLCSHGTSFSLGQTIDLSSEVRQGEFQTVRYQVEYFGDIIVDLSPQQDREPSVLPLDVTGRFEFDQQLSGEPGSMQAVRYYSKAAAEIESGQGRTASELTPDNQYILSRIRTRENQNEFQIASIGSVLQRSEYELLRNPCDPIALMGLVNQESVKVGDQWEVDQGTLGRFLNIDHVITTDVQFKLKSIDESVALIHVAGHVKGEIDDVLTELDVAGSLQFDRELGRVRAVRININQATEPGQVAPGFEGQIKLDMRLQPIASSQHLTHEKLADVMTESKIKQAFLLQPEGALFSVIHSPQWRIIAAEKEAAVLRYIQNGNMLAQCNIVRLPNRPADRPLKLAEFEGEVRKMIKDQETLSFQSSQETETSTGHATLRVAVEGYESDVRIQWLYYHISNEEGVCVTCVFTMEKKLSDQFGKADQTFVNRFKLANQRQTRNEPGETIR